MLRSYQCITLINDTNAEMISMLLRHKLAVCLGRVFFILIYVIPTREQY